MLCRNHINIVSQKKKMKFGNNMALVVLIVLLIVVLIHHWDPPQGDFLIDLIAAFSTLAAVLFALFGSFFRNRWHPIRLDLELPSQNNNFMDEWDGVSVYCHHIQVRNLTPDRPVCNCQVWLTRLLDEGQDGQTEERVTFAVPRLMEWAPSEYSPDKRTFSSTQVFDFGVTAADSRGFILRKYGGQGGMFEGNCGQGKKRRYVFSFSADNFQSSDTFAVDVEVPKKQRDARFESQSKVIVIGKDWRTKPFS